MTAQSTFYGVDFSGAVEAGKKIWIARAEQRDGRLHITSLTRACELPNGDKDRDSAYAALRKHVVSQPPALWGFDFPFSLHNHLIQRESWHDFAAKFADDYPTPESLYDKGRDAASELRAAKLSSRRAVDVAAKTPFPPHNLRLYRQTYHGIRDVLAPLARHANILPFNAHDPARPALLEICPASTLKHLALYKSYKGNKPDHISERRALIRAFDNKGVVIAESDRERIIADNEGDALDAVIAAYCTFDAYRSGEIERVAETLSTPHIEGYVYGAGLTS